MNEEINNYFREQWLNVNTLKSHKMSRIIDITLESISKDERYSQQLKEKRIGRYFRTEALSLQAVYESPFFVHRLPSQLYFWLLFRPYQMILRAGVFLKLRTKRANRPEWSLWTRRRV